MIQTNREDALAEYGSPQLSDTESVRNEVSLTYPYFHYHDLSNEPDTDPSVPLTAPGRVPNFPAKMHAILSRDDLNEIIGWMPHGRAWKVFKPREFETLVLKTYFEHSKFSSFIRQANGWGFRRINSGCDRNCYYHPRFLRGLPHLCKGMKRPGVAQKVQANPKHEPDLYKISELHPLPNRVSKESVILFSTLAGGAKTCLSIGSCIPSTSQSSKTSEKSQSRSALTPREFEALSAFYESLSSIDGGSKEFGQDFSMRMPSSSTVSSSNFYPVPLPTLLQDIHRENFNFHSLSDAHEMAFFNQPNIIPGTIGNSSYQHFSQL